jgi:pimeloyl-ACP methyl ester carboxylesterase
MALHLSPVYAGAAVPHGDREGVVLVPGFMASDASLSELHAWLARIGYKPYFSKIGRNMECPDVHIARLRETIDRAYASTGRRVTLIGHSLGGCIARGAAIQAPDKVAHVISLGSPVNGGRVHPLVAAAARYVRSACTYDCFAAMQAGLPRGVAETNIYSKSDGIVDWRTCSRARGATHVEVHGTHIGMVWNAEVYGALALAMADRRAHDHAAGLTAARRRRQLGDTVPLCKRLSRGARPVRVRAA